MEVSDYKEELLLKKLEELTAVSEKQEEVIQLLKSKLDASNQQLNAMIGEKDKVFSVKKEAEKNLQLNRELEELLASEAQESIEERESMQAAKAALSKKESELEEQKADLQKEKAYIHKALSWIRWNGRIILGFFVLCWVEAGFFKDVLQIASGVDFIFRTCSKAAGMVHIKSEVLMVLLHVLLKYLLPLGIVGICAGFIVYVVYRYIREYLDKKSLYVTMGAVYAAVLVGRFTPINSIMVFILIELIYLIRRIRQDYY